MGNTEQINKTLVEKLIKLNRECPLIPHTNAGRLFSMVRRMKAEKETDIPLNFRSGFAVSVFTGKHANEMEEQEWEDFYGALSGQLKRDYPDLYKEIFESITDSDV